MSYVMDFEDRDKVTSDDMVVPYDNGAFELVINPKSLLYLFGMRLDYSDALIGEHEVSLSHTHTHRQTHTHTHTHARARPRARLLLPL